MVLAQWFIQYVSTILGATFMTLELMVDPRRAGFPVSESIHVCIRYISDTVVVFDGLIPGCRT